MLIRAGQVRVLTQASVIYPTGEFGQRDDSIDRMKPSPNQLSASPDDRVLVYEFPMIRQIIRDETWLESERRGYEVPVNDFAVKENVCRVILRIGQQMRDSIEKQLRAN